MQVLDIGKNKTALAVLTPPGVLNLGVFAGALAAPFVGLLDLYPAAVGYSLRQLTGTATRAIAVRNNSNVTIDIGFITSGPTAGNLDTTALLAHCGAGNGYVVTWYNQMTNGASGNFIQATAAQQPRIVTAGVVLTRYGKPMIQMATISQYLYCEDLTLFRNKNYNRVYLTLSKPDTDNYGYRVFFACRHLVTATWYTRFLAVLQDSTPYVNTVFGAAKPQNAVYGLHGADPDYWPTYTDSGAKFQTSLATLNLRANWNPDLSGIGVDTGRRLSRVIKHSTDEITELADTGSANQNTVDANASNITIGGLLSGSISDVSTLIGYNELVIYTTSQYHANNPDIETNIMSHF